MDVEHENEEEKLFYKYEKGLLAVHKNSVKSTITGGIFYLVFFFLDKVPTWSPDSLVSNINSN